MLYSPKLKKAMSEIKAILEKNDIAGIVVLHTAAGNGQGFAEHLLKIDPSYSVAKVVPNNIVRFRAKLVEDFKGDKALMEKRLAATASMLNMLAVCTGELSLGTMDLSKRFDGLISAKHGEGISTSQQELDN